MGLLQLRDMYDKGNSTAYQIAFTHYFSTHTSDDMGYKLIFMQVPLYGEWEDTDNPVDSLRTDEKGVATCVSAKDGSDFIVWYD